MQREHIPPLRNGATYVLPDWKLAYISSPKAACTTIKWIIADIQGVDPKTFYSSLSTETTRATTIHQRRYLWTDSTPRLTDLTDKQLGDIRPDNGWLFFTMTRHPGARLWSAWQSKFLLREPRFRVQFRDESWLPRIPESTDDVLEDWEMFVRAIAADPNAPILQDIHFYPQSLLLNIPKTPFDRIYDTSEFKTMLGDLQTHLEKSGWKRGPIQPRRSNETPLPPLKRAFPQHVLDTIAKIYAEDFTRLGYEDPTPPKLGDGDYAPDLVSATGIVAERGDRIGDLARRAKRLQKRLADATGGNEVPDDESSENDSTAGGLWKSVTRSLRRG